MPVYGSFDSFSPILSKSEIAIAFEKLIAVWPEFARFPDRLLENNITQPFVDLLQSAAEREAWRFDFYYREKFTQEGAPVETGEGDIVIRPYPGGRSKHGFVVECKLLNVTYPSGFRDDADKYVGAGGMGDFLSGKYDRNCSDGSMLGYVMDDRVDAARAAVDSAIGKGAIELRVRPPTRLVPAPFAEKQLPVSVTMHSMPDADDFTIYHLFLPYSGAD